jgi:hypothetical protein
MALVEQELLTLCFEVFSDSSRATIFLSLNIPKCAKKFEDIKEAIRN